jgi:GNAT superfamily N-acetyltransferase
MPDSDITLATQEDYIDLVFLTRQFSKEAPETHKADHKKLNEVVQHFLDAEDKEVLLLKVNGESVGFLAVAFMEPIMQSKTVALEMAWFVEKEHRGGRNAIKLLRAFEELAVKRNALRTIISNILGLNDLSVLYKKLGYSPIETTYVKEL